MPSPRSTPLSFFLALLPFLLGGCTGDTPDLPADEVEVASVVPAAVPDPVLFDSIVWDDTRRAMDRGATVYAYSCAKCHGDTGAGDGNYQLRKRVLRPPSFLADDWRYAHDVEGLRSAIYTGTDQGMPHWGRAGLGARDMDAVSRYILYGLRRDRF